MGHEPRNRAERRAGLRKARRVAGAALTVSGTALASTAAIVATASPAAALGYVVNEDNDAGNGVCGDGSCTLRDALIEANASVGVDDTITFDPGLSNPINLTGQLEIRDSVEINGPGAASLTVDGGGNGRVFYILYAGAQIDVTISGLTISGGSAIGPGGGILNLGENLTLTNTVVTGNFAGQADGGGVAALYAAGDAPTVTVNGTSLFEYNDAYYDGGAIAVEDGTLDISGATTILYNEAGVGDGSGNGGGLVLDDADTTITGTTIISENAADGVGGAISAFQGSLSISGTTTMDGNYAYAPGGGMFVYYTEVDISGNTTISGNDGLLGGGIAVLDTGGTFSITGATISGNQASGGIGGGLWFRTNDDPVSITNTTISDNYSNDDGGGIFWYDTGADVTFTGVTITGNYAEDNGGGVYFYDPDHSISFINSTISNNEAHSGNVGGGIFFGDLDSDDTLLVQGTTIADNYADELAGGIFLVDIDGTVSIVSSTISGNEADDAGGVFLYADSDSLLEVFSSTISGNTADGEGGGAIIDSAGTSQLFNSTVSGNTAGTTGGGLFVLEANEGFDLVQTTVTNNHAPAGGAGGLYLNDLQSALRPSQSSADDPPDGRTGTWSPPALTDPEDVADKAEGASGSQGLRAQLATPDEISLIGTIVSANDALDIGGGDPQYDDTIISDHSLLGNIVPGASLTDMGGTIFSTNPGLAALANNGGPTQTHALLGASLAIDTGPLTVTTFMGNQFDQRGPGFARVINGRVDIGAYEAPLQFADFTG